MSTNEIGLHELRVFQVVQASEGWVTSETVAARAKVAPRTARTHCLRLAGAGVIDRAAVFPGHRYRMAGKPDKAYMLQLKRAQEVFGPLA